MGKFSITQVRSTIKCPKKQKLTIKALGLGRIRKCVEIIPTPQMKGMIDKVKHLVTIKKLS